MMVAMMLQLLNLSPPCYDNFVTVQYNEYPIILHWPADTQRVIVNHTTNATMLQTKMPLQVRERIFSYIIGNNINVYYHINKPEALWSHARYNLDLTAAIVLDILSLVMICIQMPCIRQIYRLSKPNKGRTRLRTTKPFVPPPKLPLPTSDSLFAEVYITDDNEYISPTIQVHTHDHNNANGVEGDDSLRLIYHNDSKRTINNDVDNNNGHIDVGSGLDGIEMASLPSAASSLAPSLSLSSTPMSSLPNVILPS
jgi:hypothetical protein